MSSEFENDILQPLPDEQLMIWYEYCKVNLPKSIRGQFFLKIQSRWKEYLKLPENNQLLKEISPKCINNFFTHRNGKKEYCTFVAITDEGYMGQDYSIFLFSMEESNQELEECLRYTKRIKWTISPLFISVQDEHMNTLKTIIHEKNYEIDFSIPNIAYRLDKEEAKTIVYTIPDHVYIAPLKTEHTELIQSTWPHRSPGADGFIRTIIILNNGLGLYSRQTNELLSWILKNDNYAPGSFQTRDTEQGKGYGKLILRAFCKKFAIEEDHDLVAFVNTVNVVSRKVFESCGFKAYGIVSWLRVKRVD